MSAALLPLAAPALPLDDAGQYVAGAYLVFVVLLIVYVGIMAAKLARISSEIASLAEAAEGGVTQPRPAAAPRTELEAEAESRAGGEIEEPAER